MKIKNVVLLCLFVSIIFSYNKLSYSSYDQGSSVAFSEVTGSATASQIPLISGLSGSATSAQIPTTITLDNLTQITTRNYSVLTGTSTISPTTATITTAVITNLTATNGTITNAYGVGFDDIAGLPSTNTELATLLPFTRNGTIISPGTITDSLTLGTTTAYNNSALTILGSKTSPLSVVMTIKGTNTTMTSDILPSPIMATSSGVTADFQAYKAFDALYADNRWVSTSELGWLTYNYGSSNSKIIKEFQIANNGANNAPKSFNFQGSTNNRTWTTLKGLSDQSYVANILNIHSLATNTASYQFYKLDVTENTTPGGANVSILELILIEAEKINTVLHIDAEGRMIYGTSTDPLGGSGTTYLARGRVGGGGLYFDSYVSPSFLAWKVLSDLGTRSNYLDDLTKLYIAKWNPRINDVSLIEAEKAAKEKYIVDGYQDWEKENKDSYTTIKAEPGSGTIISIDWKKIKKDYEILRKNKWTEDIEQQKLINEAKIDLDSDPSREYITPIADNPTTPSYFHEKNDSNTLCWNNIITAAIIAIQELANKIDKQQVEIETLKLQGNIPQ